jgi:hypothetical protein
MSTSRFVLALLILLCGCTPASPFEIELTNVGTETTYIAAADQSGFLVRVEEEISGAWTSVTPGDDSACMARCGVPSMAMCGALAPEMEGVHALLPGDSALRNFDTAWWYTDPVADCPRQTSLTGLLRVQICHGPEAVDADGLPIDEPTASGFLGGESGARLENPTCESAESSLVDNPGTLQIEIVE